MSEKSVRFSTPVCGEDVELKPKTFFIRHTEELTKSMKFLISTPALCDVVFLVGEKRDPVYGLKAILAVRSRVFCNLMATNRKIPKINKTSSTLSRLLRRFKSKKSCIGSGTLDDGWAGAITILIEDFETDIFRELIVYAHTGAINVTVNNVIGILNAAQTYDFRELSRGCMDFATKCANQSPEKAACLIDSALKYIHFKTTRILLQKALNFIVSQRPQAYKPILGRTHRKQTNEQPLHSSIEINYPDGIDYQLHNLSLSPVPSLKRDENDSGFCDDDTARILPTSP